MLLVNLSLPPQMFTKISLLNVCSDAGLFEHEQATQAFVKVAKDVFLKVQGLVTICTTTQMAFEQLPQHALVRAKEKGKAKATKENKDDNENKVTQKKCQELKDFVVPMTFTKKELAALLLLLSEYFEKDVGLLKGAKILSGRKAELVLAVPATRALTLQNHGIIKDKSRVIVAEKTGAKGAFESSETVNSDSDNDNEEERVCIIKKIKWEHIKEPVEKGKRREVEKTQTTVVISPK
ncbi:hypothetical protein C0995_011041 [Termitomyces sp. Mi166|nr:hypothetical protein C0995_011041 [Termitomyces sp. Mi166\